MQPIFLGNMVALQTPQAGSSLVVMGGSDTVVSAGSDTIFAGTGLSEIYDTGIAPASVPAGYTGDTIVLGASPAQVVVGGIGSEVFGGSGTADIFYGNTPGQLVTGSGNLNIVGNPLGLGISWGGGVAFVTHDSGGTIVHTGLGAVDRLWAAGPQS